MSERYKREIEEILRQAGEKPVSNTRIAANRNLTKSLLSSLTRSVNEKRFGISPGRIAIAAIVGLLSGIVLRYFVPEASTPLLWVSLALFIMAYALFLARPKTTETRWRGQVISYDKTSFGDRVKKWLKR